MSKTFLQITANLVGKPRFAVMEGRDYIVLPVTILVEGVHAGSSGPIFYPLEQMEKFATAWNHKPVVVYHPKVNGQYVSADDPTILTANKVGILMSNRISGNAQVAEAWLEKSRLKEVDPRILDSIDKGLVVEVSTGLFSDNDETPGTWNGEEYIGTATNFRPDHLALLPDLIGACSIEDGCGMFTASQAIKPEKAKEIQHMLSNALKDEEEKPVNNELSHDQIRSELSEEIWKATQYDKVETYKSAGWLYDVYDDYVVYCVEDKYYRQNYTKSDTAVELSGDPVEVQREVKFSPISNDEENDMGKETTANCDCPKVKALVDGLVTANKNWSESDREWLLTQNENILKKFTAMEAEVKEEPKEEEDEKEETVVNTTTVTPPAKKKKMTAEEYVQNAPAGPVREMLARGLSALNAERKRLTDIILSNETNQFSAEELAKFDASMLQKLAALAVQEEEEKVDQPLDLFNFVGQGGAPQTNTHQEEALPLPRMTFNNDKK